MVKRTGGSRRKTRHVLRHSYRTRGKISVSHCLQELASGDRVALTAHPSMVHKGLYFRRFHGWHGKVVGKQGRCYVVRIVDGKVPKLLQVHPIHLTKV